MLREVITNEQYRPVQMAPEKCGTLWLNNDEAKRDGLLRPADIFFSANYLSKELRGRGLGESRHRPSRFVSRQREINWAEETAGGNKQSTSAP